MLSHHRWTHPEAHKTRRRSERGILWHFICVLPHYRTRRSLPNLCVKYDAYIAFMCLLKSSSFDESQQLCFQHALVMPFYFWIHILVAKFQTSQAFNIFDTWKVNPWCPWCPWFPWPEHWLLVQSWKLSDAGSASHWAKLIHPRHGTNGFTAD